MASCLLASADLLRIYLGKSKRLEACPIRYWGNSTWARLESHSVEATSPTIPSPGLVLFEVMLRMRPGSRGTKCKVHTYRKSASYFAFMLSFTARISLLSAFCFRVIRRPLP
jgi:hypothetical protein